MQTLRHVVAGTDFSAAADVALDLALQLAVAAGAGLTLVHVCELGVDDLDDQHLRRGHEALARVVADLAARVARPSAVPQASHVPAITGVVRSGRPWVKLDNVAAEVGAGLIVVGRHGAGRDPRVPLGSVAAALVRSASRPVLTVPASLDRLEVEAINPHS